MITVGFGILAGIGVMAAIVGIKINDPSLIAIGAATVILVAFLL